MKSVFRHILVVSAIIMILMTACGRSDEKVIPRGKLSRIYAEMLLTDQWVKESVDVRRMADTTLIYEPILEKYGYDKMDYIHTVDVYLDDPERFAKIWEKTSEILGERLKELKSLKEAIEEEREKNKIITDFCAEIHFPYMYSEPYVHYYDSLSVEMDTLLFSYRFTNIERSDTTYDGLIMNVRTDTLSVIDSLARIDSLAAADSIVSFDKKEITDKVQKVAKPVENLIKAPVAKDKNALEISTVPARKMKQIKEFGK